MAVYFKFKSAKDFDSVPIDGHFISVGHLKEKIFESKHLGRGTDFDLMVSNAQTNEEYADEAMLIPKNTSVLVRRIPGRPRKPIVSEQDEPKKVLENSEFDEAEPPKNGLPVAEPFVARLSEEADWDEFGNDLYAIPEMLPQQLSNQLQDAPPPSKADEDSKIQALIDTPALDWQRQTQEAFGSGRGYGRGSGGRMMAGRGFGRSGGLERKTPPQGYICHRCKVPGHFIQHCPTNGDPNYDIKRVKPPTGIPKSMLMATPEGSYALPSGAVAVLKPNEAAFEREIDGLPSTRSVSDLPPELHCPLCKEVMKDAVLTSKCCFKSFCDKCIRDYIISKLVCVCGATNILADDLLPNKTLRETINRILESTTSSAENAGSIQVQDMESARCPPPRAPSPTLSATAKESQVFPHTEVGENMKERLSEEKSAANVPQQSIERSRATKQPDASEATLESASVKEPTSQGSAPLAEEEVQQKLPVGVEPGKKKKKKKLRVPPNDMQWRMPQDLGAQGFGMPFGPSAYNPYWSGVQWGMDGFMAPYGGTMPYMGLAPDPFALSFGAGILPQDPFGGQGYMFQGVPPPRDLSELGMGSKPAPPPVMSREEFEARKADLRRKRKIEQHGERESYRDKDFGREVSSTADISAGKSKSKPSSSHPSGGDHKRETRSSSERVRESDPARKSPRPSKRKHHHAARDEDHSAPDSKPTTALPPAAATAVTADRKQKASVFSRISFPASGDGGGNIGKKQKVLPESASSNGFRDKEAETISRYRASSNGHHHHDHQPKEEWKPAAAVARKPSLCEQESSDEEHHFKRRRPSRHDSGKWEEEARHSRGSRERDHGAKHR